MAEGIYPYLSHTPEIAPDAFIAPGSRIIGDVKIGEGSSVWYNVVVRGDVNSIRIGRMTNVQDNTTIHADSGRSGLRADGHPTVIGDYVSIGHGAVLHACTIEDHCLIGMGAVVLDGSVIGRGSVVAAGAVVTKATVIPPFSMVVGIPARAVKSVDPQKSIADRDDQAQHYNRLANENRLSLEGRARMV